MYVEQRDTCQRLETALSQHSCFASLAFRDQLVVSVHEKAFCVVEVARPGPIWGHTPAVALPHQDRYSSASPATRTEHLPSHVHLPCSFTSARNCHYPSDLSDRLWLKVSRPRREVSVQAESLCTGIQLISWLTAFPSLLLSVSGTEFIGLTQQACSVADHVNVSVSSLLSDVSYDIYVAVPVDLTSSVCEGSQQMTANIGNRLKVRRVCNIIHLMPKDSSIFGVPITQLREWVSSEFSSTVQ